VKTMIDRCKSKPEDILAGIGPAIGPCCYQVQEQTADLFRSGIPGSQQFIREEDNAIFLNLWEVNRLQLVQQGIHAEKIEVAQLCTACHRDLFFSYRREKGKTGRFGAFVGLRC
jgi:copper oxidase (laccase) domain-containing protein